MCRVFNSIRLIVSVIAIHCSSVLAATIDEFQVQASVSSPEQPGDESVHTTSSQAVGGGRSLVAINLDGSAGNGVTLIRTKDSGGEVVLTVGAHTGRGIVLWDGDTDPSSKNRNGLQGLDLTQDDADAFQLQIKDFDYPGGNRPVQIRLRIYDPSGSQHFDKHSEIDITFNQFVDILTGPVTLTVPFSLFTVPGNHLVSGFNATTTLSEGGAVASNVGAIELEFEGRAIDVVMGTFTTNGRCTAVPNANGTVLDECGVCLDDTANANQGKDACGICYKGPPGYDYDSNKVFDACGLCPTHPQYVYPAGDKDACGLCPTEPNWGNSQDPCGVCFGDGSSCADCSGTPNGSAQLDQCNVCGGDGTTCLDCNNVPFGGAKLDACGVCDGDNSSCKDCAGVINGTQTEDVCGVCGGTTTDLESCTTSIQQCVTVNATPEVRKFQRDLTKKAKKLRARYRAERARAERNGCGIKMSDSDAALASAFKHILTRGKEIFSAGVEVCGDSCITTSYASQVKALKPTFKILERQATSLAKKVNRCYNRIGVSRSPNGGARGVAGTVSAVNRELNNLIESCRKQRVCPPGSK